MQKFIYVDFKCQQDQKGIKVESLETGLKEK